MHRPADTFKFSGLVRTHKLLSGIQTGTTHLEDPPVTVRPFSVIVPASSHERRYRKFFQRPQIQPSRAAIQNSSPSIRPGGQTPTAVYQTNQHIMMVNHLPMPYPMPQGPQYCIPQYRHSGPPFVGPPQQYPVQPPGPGPFYPGPGPGEFPNAYGTPFYPSQPVYQSAPIIVPTQQQQQQPPPAKREKKTIRIRDPNQGGKDITEEIMSGGGSRNPTPPIVRPTPTPTPPQFRSSPIASTPSPEFPFLSLQFSQSLFRKMYHTRTWVLDYAKDTVIQDLCFLPSLIFASNKKGRAVCLKNHLLEVVVMMQLDPGCGTPPVHEPEESRSAPHTMELQSGSTDISTTSPMLGQGRMCISMAMSSIPSSSPDDYRQFHKLFRSVADALHLPLEEMQDSQHQLLDILHASVPARVMLPINNAILQPACTV
ncbi:Eukaryotic translation initiation factor 4 gamma 3 [Chelonia mydas]|uniref:Eukaryotic translation initiation factor 4 gamma 3 n=1 Tax=Chelonia mydas TaxID=8469 RepID=M7AX25_CHEMY|nr:Eukaryotic translation initiation factor 4 gamma 3 [Chelonia mydas]